MHSSARWNCFLRQHSQEDRSVLDLLTADYTFVNERLAKHYGIPNVYGPRFRRVTLIRSWTWRRGLLGKRRAADGDVAGGPHFTSDTGKWFLADVSA